MPRGMKQGVACDVCGRALGTRNKLGRCIRCRTKAFTAAIRYDHEPSPAAMERILYYRARAALGLPIFDGSPWARLPGAANRLWERRHERTGAPCTVAAADKVE